ncbi:hypothetical protein TanjilG_06939 [Lupinus angustifolius]|uniref:Uncharacterized protein n=1 Tax=Lupinus angustifolius TaxID=3871 RepID=A0A394DEY7_LUPAN|nr:hypothetical protein TanjilG_06939 [Lupinus angustifolius]
MPRFFPRQYLHMFKHKSISSAFVLIPSPFWFQRWSPMNSGDGRTEMPHSPTI